jgi:SHS family lactate transporter-like MFS transporter
LDDTKQTTGLHDAIPLSAIPQEGHGPAVFAGFLGWTLDAFDFFLVALSLTAIAQEFHRSDKEIALSITLTLVFRPVGALIFGAMADRYGRRIPLMIDLVFYSLIEVLTGFAHSFAAFLVLRALFGIGMGGEWGVGASLAMEKVPPRLRGFLSGMLQQGYALGYLLAAICFYVVFPRWGWRPMFFIGGLPALLGLFVRFKVKESEVWRKTRQPDWSSLGREIVSHWKLFLYLTLLMMMMNFASHGTQDMFPTFLQRFWGMGAKQRAGITAISMVGAILGGMLFGFLSDRWGRRRTMITALIGAIAMVPLWAYSPSLLLLVVGAFLIQFMVQGAWGIIPAHLNELAPGPVRAIFPGVAYQLGNLLSSRNAVFQAAFATRHNGGALNVALSGTVVIVALVVAGVSALGPEAKGANLAEPTAQ